MKLTVKQALTMFRQLGDRPAEGRVYGNLGNTHYLLGNFHEAIECHKEVSRVHECKLDDRLEGDR
ncbi:hypothetical protein X801_07923 [Opisthorchis viverrini]|uniref:Tetratricopeptide repeat protein n=1 Tax=Opisthorchis viverrini TaxID=6198 RepID=A0A1S8WP64_OPIVI|nr:hypothetical protein X801_07923 [Opisthorchis viverrini]